MYSPIPVLGRVLQEHQSPSSKGNPPTPREMGSFREHAGGDTAHRGESAAVHGLIKTKTGEKVAAATPADTVGPRDTVTYQDSGRWPPPPSVDTLTGRWRTELV